LATPAGVDRRDVETAEEMRAALASALGPDLRGADALVMSAAVADFKPAQSSATKIKKGDGEAPAIALAKNPDLIAEIGARRSKKTPMLVAFALETGDDAHVLAYAKKKLTQKAVDLVVANAAHESLGHADNRVALVDERGASPFVSASKEALADLVLDRVAARLAGEESSG
jgi:phosphopantothenoylcysteine decarboxylase/phosphopantothenate--cysteine ligase